MKFHYSKSSLTAALDLLPVEAGDTLFIHSNIGYFGRPDGVSNGDELCELFFDSLMQRLGSNGTLVVPTFTYSFPRKEIYDPDKSDTDMGTFSEWIRKHDDAHRSLDPCYSVAAIGAKAQFFTNKAPENSFDKEAFFGRFLDQDGLIFNLNFDAGSTFLHFLERENNVPYRFDKTFEGRICNKGVTQNALNTIFVRYASDDRVAASFEPFHALSVSESLYQTHDLGRGQMGCIRASSCQALIAEALPKRPWMLTRGDGVDFEPDLKPEPTYRSL
ncbi:MULTISPECIES: AAC(3) family N-acetyltransferase [unclassified Pseudovibrio]|uniref:AAC(3) family N-acetyltransferase n=1 Tax=unclassified Pseudovibrio TaxID=2627060 RepID=UPI0007AEA6D1|nr:MULTISPECIES: AAC(3) family N-acetyltransferase [unclassified Pseudovibrio]KZL01858.1 Aminoglycoside 3-N-acetyltransferase [Pseudovibrio sp. W74]KZL02980.1 Aminoglycoside 3-N-acetyltransferase [Pseudovibrio sp. Ad14]